MLGNSSNLEREGAEGAIAANMNRLLKEQDARHKTAMDQRREAASSSNSRKGDAYEHKDDQALDKDGRPVQSAAIKNRAQAAGRNGAPLMGEQPVQAGLHDFEFRVKAGVVKDLSLDYSVSFYLESNHILALAQYEYARLTGLPPADLHILWITDQSVVEQNPEALIEDNYRQLYTGINSALKGHLTFLGVSNYNHWAIIALLPSDNGEVSVVYINPAYGKRAESYFGCKPVGLALCQNIVSQISSIPLNDNTPRITVAEHIYLEPTQQIESNCGAVAGLNIAGIAAWYRGRREVSLEEFLGGLKYNEVLSSPNKKKGFEALIKACFNGIKTGSISMASPQHAFSTTVLKAKMDNDYYEAIQRQLLCDREEAELLHTYEQQNLMEGYDIELQEKMFLYYKTLQHSLHSRHHNEANGYASLKPTAAGSAQEENGSQKRKRLKLGQEVLKPSSLDDDDESYMNDETDGEAEDNESAIEDKQHDTEEHHALRAKPDSYPNDLVHGLLSAHCADETDKYAGMSKVKAGDSVIFSKDNALYVRFMADKVNLNDYLLGWSASDVTDDAQTGYLGIIYVNERERQVVLAHRSTNFALGLTTKNLFKQSGVQVDVESALIGNIVTHQAHAYLATGKAVAYAKKSGFTLSITGHSLGAWLAELSVFYCNTDMDYKNVKGVTFDGPGSYEMMQQMKPNIHGAGTILKEVELDIVSYLSAPNIVNSANEHIGMVYRIFPEIEREAPNWLVDVTGEKNADALISTFGHDLPYILPYFDINSGIPNKCKRVIKWPSVTHKEYGVSSQSLFSRHANEAMSRAITSLDMSGTFTVIGIKAADAIFTKLAGKEASTLGTLVYFIRDFVNGKIKQDQFWDTHKYLDKGKGYGEIPQSAIDYFWRLYKAQYHTIEVDRHSREKIDNIDEWLEKLKQSGARLGNLKGKFKRDIKMLLDQYSYKAPTKMPIKTRADVTVSELRDKMRILLHKYGEEELAEFVNSPEIRNEIAPYFGITEITKNKFIGRNEELRDISNKLDDNRIVIIKGLPGVGKTSIARYYAQTFKDRTPVWFIADTKESLARSYREFGETLLLPLEKQEETIMMRLVNNRVSQTTQALLFIFDNVDEGYVDAYARNLPSNVDLLITTKHSNSLSHLGPEIELKSFSTAIAMNYLMGNGVKERDAELLIDKMGTTIPQDLALIVGYLKDNIGKTVKDVRASLKDKTVFEVTISEFIKKDKIAWQILQYMSWLNPDFIPEKILFKLVSDKQKLQAGIVRLERLSLVSTIEKTKNRGFKLNREVQKQTFQYVQAHRNAKIEKLVGRLLQVLNKLLPDITKSPNKQWTMARLHIPSVESLFKNIKSREVKLPNRLYIAELNEKLGQIYDEILINFRKALFYKKQALEMMRSIYKDGSADVASSLNVVGGTYLKLGKAAKSLYYFEQALDMRQALCEDNDPDVADSLNNVGVAYEELGNVMKGLDYKKRALNMNQALYKGNHPNIAGSLNNVGVAYGASGDVMEGLKYKKQALEMMQALYKSAHPDVASLLHNIGAAYIELEDANKGLNFLKQALDMRNALYNGKHPDIASSLNGIGAAHIALRDIDNGLVFFEQALDMRQTLYNGDHPDVAESMINVGSTYIKLGDISKGLDYQKRALEMVRGFYKAPHPKIARYLSKVGLAYKKAGKIKKGLDYYEQSLDMRRVFYEGAHPDIADSLRDIGVAYEKLGKADEALDYQQQALNMMQTIYKGNHRVIAGYLNDLGLTYERLGDIEKGLHYQELALTMRQALYNGNHPEVAASLSNLGIAYSKSGNVIKGLDYQERSLRMRQALYKDGHIDVVRSLNTVGVTYREFGHVSKGLDYQEQAIEMMESIYKRDHPDIANSLSNLGAIYNKLGNFKKSFEYLERALKMRQALYSGNHPNVADSLSHVGFAYHKLGEARKCLDYQLQALKMMQALYVGAHHNVALALNNVGVAYDKLGDTINSLDYHEQALKMMQLLYKVDHTYVVMSFNNVGLRYQDLGDIGKYNLFKQQAISNKGFINRRGRVNQVTIRIKQRLQNTLNKIQELSAKGVWQYQYKYRTSVLYDSGVLGYLEEGYLKKQLGDLWDTRNLRIAKTLCFEAINIGIANSQEQNHICAIEFANAYPDLIAEIIMEHPEYFILENLAKACLSAEDYQEVAGLASVNAFQQNKKKRKEPFRGEGTMKYVGASYYEYYNTAVDEILNRRLSILDLNVKRLDSLYLGEDFTSITELAYKVSSELSNNEGVLVLSPANLHGKHWLGLAFRKSGPVVEVIYMDSEQEAMAPWFKAGLEGGLARNGYLSLFSTLRLEKQSYNNCGPEVVENFVYYLTGTRATQEGAVWVHSLLLENSLLDREEYGLKIEENNRRIGFLSNEAPLAIRSIGVSALPALENPSIEDEDDSGGNGYNGGETVNAINSLLHRASIGFKTLDFVVDSARLGREPTVLGLKKLALDYAHLYGMASGVNGYSIVIGGAEAVYQTYLGEYRAALGVAAGTASAMALPVLLAMANRPYLGVAYGAYMAVSTAYGAILNAYSFALELGSGDAALKSAMAYKDLAEWLAESPLQALYDFGAKAKEYKLWANDLLFEKEKSVVEAQIKDKGEFGQKIFDYIYLPMLLEKYGLLNDVIRGTLTEEEAQGLKAKHVVITYGSQHYEHCVTAKALLKVEEGIEQYYCYNLEEQVLDHVVIVGGNNLEVLERL